MTVLQLVGVLVAAAAARDAKELGLQDRCRLLEATLRARGEVLQDGVATPIRPFIEVFHALTSRDGRTWVRVKTARGGWIFRPGESCGPDLILARKSPAHFDPRAPQEIVQVEFLDSLESEPGVRIRFHQHMSVFNLRRGFAAAQEPMCYLGELTRGPAGWAAKVLERRFDHSANSLPIR